MAPLTAAEKQKRYKEKLKANPELYEEYKRKKRENYHAKKRLVKDLTPKEKSNARIIWKLRQQKHRRNKKNLERVLNITPPSSPTILQDYVAEPNAPRSPEVYNVPVPNKRGRKKGKRSKLYKDNEMLKEKINILQRRCEKYKKRFERIEKKYTRKDKPKVDATEKYKRLSNAIQQRYKKVKNRKDQRLIKSVFEDMDESSRKLIVKESLGLQGKLRTKSTIGARNAELKRILHDFFIRDDISRATAGKKETVTRAKEKFQKRYLLDDMKKLYKTFRREMPDKKCSYYYFTRNRPVFVVKPSIDSRETCLCKIHINPVYKAQSLKKKHVIETSDLNELIISITCNVNSQSCMYGTCEACGCKEIKHDSNKDDEQIAWCEWIRSEELYEKNGKKIKAVKNVKKTIESQTKNLIENFNKEMKILKKHVYNIRTQNKNFRQAINGLQRNEVVVVADFSENYNCKHHEEIQSHHFGGSRLQVSLHTVVTYILENDSNHTVKSYCTISSSTNHQPAAIWAHLNPILKDIRENKPNIETIHFFSDGPFSQYRQKQNFYLCCTKLFDYGFRAMTWSFFEAGHGKGPADGIGGFLKRRADSIVANGVDIADANQFYQALNHQSKITLFLIPPEDIDTISKELPPKITPLPGTINVHQVFTKVRGELKYRNLSCFCQRGHCNCIQPKTYLPLMTPVSASKNKANRKIDNPKSRSPATDKNENIPLSPINKDLFDLAAPRYKSFYDLVYSTPNASDEEQEPSTSRSNVDKENRPICVGDYLIVKVNATKGKTYNYACVVDHLDEDGEIKVTFLRCVKNGRLFRLDLNDTAYVEFADVVKTLEDPVIKIKRGQTYYEFSKAIEVFEK